MKFDEVYKQCMEETIIELNVINSNWMKKIENIIHDTLIKSAHDDYIK